jgi:hypothetical protein
MIPRPKKATRISELLLAMKGLFGLDMSRRIKVKQAGLDSILKSVRPTHLAERFHAGVESGYLGGTAGITRFSLLV